MGLNEVVEPCFGVERLQEMQTPCVFFLTFFGIYFEKHFKASRDAKLEFE